MLYIFICLLTEYLGGENYLIVQLEVLQKQIKHAWPCDCNTFKANRYNHQVLLILIFISYRAFYYKIKQGVLQFVFLKPLTAIVALILDFFGIYNEGDLSIKYGYIYIAFINNLSVSVILFRI